MIQRLMRDIWPLVLLAVFSIGTAQAQTITYIHTDALGSVVAESDASGNVIKRYDYEPYGAAVGEGVADAPGYTGHVSDAATGLSYMQQRYMDPELGIFLSVDPVTAYEQPVVHFNGYRYANSNPYRYTDPDGRQSVGEMIDSGAQGCGPVSCAGWAGLSALWTVFGAEGISQISDKGFAGTDAGTRSTAGLEVAAAIPLVGVVRAGTVVIGSAQKTKAAGQPSGHAFRSLREASAMLQTGAYEKISMHRSLKTLTGGAVNSRLKPDVAGLRPDGRVDVTEVLSPGQKSQALQAKYTSALGDRMGKFQSTRPSKVMCTGSRIAKTSC